MEAHGGAIEYKANVKQIVVEGEGPAARAVGVRLADGRVFRWDAFQAISTLKSDMSEPSKRQKGKWRNI